MKILLEVEVKVNGNKCLKDCRYLAFGGWCSLFATHLKLSGVGGFSRCNACLKAVENHDSDS